MHAHQQILSKRADDGGAQEHRITPAHYHKSRHNKGPIAQQQCPRHTLSGRHASTPARMRASAASLIQCSVSSIRLRSRSFSAMAPAHVVSVNTRGECLLRHTVQLHTHQLTHEQSSERQWGKKKSTRGWNSEWQCGGAGKDGRSRGGERA